MQIVRTIIWVLLSAALLAFSAFNWEPVELTLWENLVLETKVPALVIISFLLGLVPMWVFHRSVKWSLNRRIRSLENAARSNALQRRHDPAGGDHAAVAATGAAPVEKAVGKAADTSADSTAKAGDTLTPTQTP